MQGFVLEDATGLAVKGNIDVHSIYASSLPSTNPSFAPQKHLEMQSMWKAPALPEKPVELFIGILSAGNHFAERMAVRKSWMQQKLVRSSKVVARFFVALVSTKRKSFQQSLKLNCILFMLIHVAARTKGSQCGSKERSRVLW